MVVNITEAIQMTNLEIWDQDIKRNQYWQDFDLLNEDGDEKYQKGLYVHIMSNELEHPVFDNNPRIKVVIFPQSFMVKFGKCEDGILKRRKDDFSNHYHERSGIQGTQSIKLTPYKKRGSNNRQVVLGKRVGSGFTKLHLILDFNGKTKEELGGRNGLEGNFNRMIRESLLSIPGAKKIPKERVNIPMNSIELDNLISKLSTLCEEFINQLE